MTSLKTTIIDVPRRRNERLKTTSWYNNCCRKETRVRHEKESTLRETRLRFIAQTLHKTGLMDFLPKWEINPALPQGKMKISFRLYYFFLRPGNPLPQELSPRGKGTALATPRFKVSPLCCSLWTSDRDRNSLHAF